MKKKVTEAELDILQVLWKHSPQSVRFVHQELNKEREVVYTTVLKQMQLMAGKKNLLERDTSQRTHIYKAIVSESEIQKTMVNKMVDGIFQGSPLKLVMHALGHEKTSKKDLEAIKNLIQELENDKNDE